jgi:hypothetical protein
MRQALANEHQRAITTELAELETEAEQVAEEIEELTGP